MKATPKPVYVRYLNKPDHWTNFKLRLSYVCVESLNRLDALFIGWRR